jgi:5-methylcytosine-specific restriction endonuclease McrA
MPPKKINRNNWVKGKLRQMSLRWGPRGDALRAARVDRGLYRCAYCKDLFKSSQVHVDHINPIVPIDNNWDYGHIDWNIYIPRLFCEVEDFQVLCTQDHENKTFLEDQMRNHYNEIKREKRKQDKKLDKSKNKV